MPKGIITAGLLAGALVASPWARAEDVQKAEEKASQKVDQAEKSASNDKTAAENGSSTASASANDTTARSQHRDTDAIVTTNHDRNASTQHRTARESVFEGKSNYDLKGRIEKVSGHSVTVRRDNLPSVTLTTMPGTRISVNGNDQASTSQLKAGQDVSASFNLQGSKPVAVDIQAKTHR